MVPIAEGELVAIHYLARDEHGAVIDSSEGEAPVEFVAGGDAVIRGVSEAVVGMTVGERKTVELAPEDGFGPGAVAVERSVERHLIPDGAHVGDAVSVELDGVGALLWLTAVDDQVAVLSACHPLAGVRLTVELVVVARHGEPPP